MRRTVRDNRPDVKRVEKVVLSEKPVKRQMIIAALLLLFGMVMMGISVKQLLTTEAGWKKIEVSGSNKRTCGDDFVLLYNLGASEVSATVENKALTKIYSDTMSKAYDVFSADEDVESVYNLHYINQNPNTEIEVDGLLYDAFEKIAKYENDNIYLGPVYETYDDIFSCQDDVLTKEFDPNQNKEVKTYYNKIANYIKSKDVELELLGDNKVKLKVSKEYENYLKENGIQKIIDLSIMKNAFVIDYVADELIEAGFENGCITSYDGFSRNLNSSNDKVSYNLFGKINDKVAQVASYQYSGQQAIVYFRDFPVSEKDSNHYYTFKDGRVAASYVDINDGIAKTAVESLLVYGQDMKCSDIMLESMLLYSSDEFDKEESQELNVRNINWIYTEDGNIYHSQKDAEIKVDQLEAGKYNLK